MGEHAVDSQRSTAERRRHLEVVLLGAGGAAGGEEIETLCLLGLRKAWHSRESSRRDGGGERQLGTMSRGQGRREIEKKMYGVGGKRGLGQIGLLDVSRNYKK